MNAQNRRKKILEELEKNRAVNITELAEWLDVSSMTVRRDLNRLAEQGIVTLVHGGAVLNMGTTALQTMNFREKKRRLEKNHIGRFCAQLIKESESVFIDCGSTTKGIAEALTNRNNITVLTNSLPVMNVLTSAKNNKLISVPGEYVDSIKGFVGQMAVDFISQFQIDIVFIGVAAFDLEHGMSSPSIMDAGVKRALLRQARRKILVLDHSKFGVNSFMTFGAAADIDMIVTDQGVDANLVEAIRHAGIEIVLV